MSTDMLFILWQTPTMGVGLGYIPLVALYTNQELTDLWGTHKTERLAKHIEHGDAVDRDRQHLWNQRADLPQQAEHVTCVPKNPSHGMLAPTLRT